MGLSSVHRRLRMDGVVEGLAEQLRFHRRLRLVGSGICRTLDAAPFDPAGAQEPLLDADPGFDYRACCCAVPEPIRAGADCGGRIPKTFNSDSAYCAACCVSHLRPTLPGVLPQNSESYQPAGATAGFIRTEGSAAQNIGPRNSSTPPPPLHALVSGYHQTSSRR